MKVKEIIAIVDDLKPNKFDDYTKLKWLSDIEKTIIDEVINTHETETAAIEEITDLEKELHADREVYIHYLFAQIDYNYFEFERYNNDIAKFNEAYSRYASSYNRHNMPKQPKLKGV